MAMPFTSTSLHAPPRLDTVRRETIRATGLALRSEGIFFACALALVFVLGLWASIQASGNPQHSTGFLFVPDLAVPMILAGLLLPFGVWRSEDPSRRAYHWSMPVPRESHTLLKLFAGWLWLMAAVACYLLMIALLGVVSAALAGDPVRVFGGPAWWWAVAFTSASIGYLLTSIAVLSSEHPWRWIGGLLAGYVVTYLLLDMMGLERVADTIDMVRDGYYGLKAAVFADVWSPRRGAATTGPDRWIGATLIWGAIGMIGVVLVARRHRDG